MGSAVPDMFAVLARCTMEARRALFHARQAVTDIGGEAISPEHLAWGLLHADVLASRHLVALPTAATDLRDRVKSLLAGPGAPIALDVPLTDAANQVIERARSQADTLGHGKIRSDHILLGLLAGEGAAGQLFKDSGVREDAVRQAITERDPDEDER